VFRAGFSRDAAHQVSIPGRPVESGTGTGNPINSAGRSCLAEARQRRSSTDGQVKLGVAGKRPGDESLHLKSTRDATALEVNPAGENRARRDHTTACRSPVGLQRSGLTAGASISSSVVPRYRELQ
jgi:hypothetical protein